MNKHLAFPLLLLTSAHAQPLDKTVIAEGFHDPMEIAVAPDGDLFVTEREGRLLRVRPSTGGIFEIGALKVEALRASDPNSNYAREDGLQGIALDPDFANNQRIYLYYSDPEKVLDRLSRFTLKDGKLDKSSELVLIEVPTTRENKVCHHGGSVEFGPDGLLYLSTGDNTNPFESSGSSPIDDREGHEYANAARSAGNTNDLRGKILRIKPTETGYEIPEGNLFKPGTPKTRPEIYVMGCRNPFRISIDPKTRNLFWGEVGPDAASDTARGPRGQDEVNVAKAAGNFGWPFVIGNNEPYSRFDFATNKVGEKQNPAAPKNESRSNTGLTDLPPAQPALIWYPYAESPEFPVLGKGGRNAMAGPVFYHDSARKYNILGPEDDKTLLAYEWMRGKIFKAKLDADEKLKNLEVLADGFIHPMDLEMAQDGTLWMLEYGSDWWFNKNGKILRLLPSSGNKPPTISIEVSSADANQFLVKEASDPDGDPVTITWWLTEGATERSLGTGQTASLSGTTGTEVRAVATDGKGGIAIARVSLVKEKALPQLILDIGGQPKSLNFNQEVSFAVRAEGLDSSKVTVRARYIPPTGHDAGGPQFSTDVETLVTSKLCLACHQVAHPSVGPQYLNVSLKYRDRADAVDYLKGKLKNGSTGAWGEVPMPPQIAVNDEEANTIIRAILGLADGISEASGSASGKLKLAPQPPDAAPAGAWEISADAPGFLGAKFRVAAEK
jgi:cytochrome c